MIFKRTFLNVKKISTSAINYFVRTQWIIDYVKAAVKPLEHINMLWYKYTIGIRDYVLYSNQKYSLKVFVDDQVDIIEKRTYITEADEEQMVIYGYSNNTYKQQGTYVDEQDPNIRYLYGYTDINDVTAYKDNTIQFIDEVDPDPISLYGYVVFTNLYNALISAEGQYVLSSPYGDLIYTADMDVTIEYYEWFDEGRYGDDDIIFWIHNSIYNNLTDIDKENLIAKLERYVTTPYNFKLMPF